MRRTTLVRRLAGSPDARLVVIVAPPGYGKTSLISEWGEHDEREFVWLAPDALEAVDLRSTADAILRPAEDRGGFVVVLDDAHLAPAEIVRNLLDVLLAEMPDGATVALSSRAEPPLPLGRLRARRALVEVRVPDLAMMPAEASLLLRQAGLELDFTAVQALVRRTEGWPAGLYLGALSVREQADVASALGRLRGDDHHLAEYFRDEVLSVLPADLTEFAVRTSVLEELSGPVCDAVLETRGSAPVLRRLEKAVTLLRPLDPAHEVFRWHGLFRDALGAELRRTEPELVQALHERACAWYEAHGETDQAISHAVCAGDLVHTGNLLWASIVAYVTQGRNEIVQGWLASFNRDELGSYAPLALAAAHSFLAAGNAAEARHLAVAAAAAAERSRSARGPRSLRAGLAGIEAIVGRAGVGGMGEAAERACKLEPEDSPWRPLCLFLRGTALHLAGNPASAVRLLDEGADLSAATAPSITSLCLAQAAMIAIEQQDWDAAAELTDRARRVIDERGLAEYPICALAFAASAAARAHHGRADEAKRDLRSGIELLTVLGDFIPWYGAEARILLAHASLWLADVVGARTLLAEASRLARRTTGAVIFERWFDDAWSYMDALAETSLAGPSSLTIAELRILRFLPSHRSFREIASQLGVSANTVKTQAHAVYRKLGAASRSEAVMRASDAGLLGQ
ncbi:MAG TPA: LuxR C-terminal-related transcriptional regulator [Solirubrobacteraceae bacterium]|nr:LuxR C-terminal-related transcriptional regulator [Solirubrobacteraceae bacterium]